MCLLTYLMLVIICSYLFYDKSKHFAKLSIYVITNVYSVANTHKEINKNNKKAYNIRGVIKE